MSNSAAGAEGTPPVSYLGEIRTFCTSVSELMAKDKPMPGSGVWMEILTNIIDDEEKSRGDALDLIDTILCDGDSTLSESSRERLDSVRSYLRGDTGQ
jgi:hypothetical protein